MRPVICFPFVSYLLIFYPPTSGEELEQTLEVYEDLAQTQTVEEPRPRLRLPRQSQSPSDFNSYSYLLPHFDEDENFSPPHSVVERDDDDDDVDLTPLLSRGPVESRDFVTVDTLRRSGKQLERTFRFIREKREGEDEGKTKEENQNKDEVKQNAEGRANEDETKKKDGKNDLGVSIKAKELIDKNTTKALKEVPAGFTTSHASIRFKNRITFVEKLGDSRAKLGDRCQPSSVLDPDHCEKAVHPNKNKMACNSVIDPRMPTLLRNTCVCKFYQVNTTFPGKWMQMRSGNVTVGNTTTEVCLVPKGGVCHHRIPTQYKDTHGRTIFEVDTCQGHFQCDNTDLVKNNLTEETKQRLAGGDPDFDITLKGLSVLEHCTEKDFLSQLKEDARKQVLVCSKPHPRRFSNYDEFKFYCLPDRNRDPEMSQTRGALPPDDENII